MTRAHIMALIGVVLVGCDTGDNAPENGGPTPANGQQTGAKEYPPATSAEELVENYKQAFTAGDITAIEKMVHWEGTNDSDTKDAVLIIALSTGTAGKRIFTKAELRPAEADDVKPWTNLKPEAVFDYTVSNREDTASKSTSVPIVNVDGHYYFYFAALPKNDE